ncbi:MAG TPA: hypothetical protein DCP06_06805 [Lachnospiraceae bacterium]|nr:hypothetical protein [Lachnospiraceae bacterium]
MAKKKKEKKDPEEIRFYLMLACVVLIVAAGFVLGVFLLNMASVLGILVMLGGLIGATFLLVSNMKRFKIYDRLEKRTRNNEVKESEKLDEDMVKCQDRIKALDERAAASPEPPSE